MNTLSWEDHQRTRLLQTPIFSVEEIQRRSFEGKVAPFTVLEAPDWVNIIALVDDNKEDSCFIMVKQYRHGSGRLTTEFPAGVIEPGESPEAAAQREFEEETGFRAATYRLLGAVNPNPAFMGNRVYTFLAEGVYRSGPQKLDENESIEVVKVRERDLERLIGEGEFDNGIMVIAAYHYLRYKKTANHKLTVEEGSDRI